MDFGTKLSADIIGLWLWPLAALYVLRIVKGADPRWWLVVGTIVGICVESKYTVIFFAISIVFGLLVLPQRRVLFTAWFAGGILVAALIALPNFLWQAAHGFPMWTLLLAAAQYKDVPLTPLQFLVTQLLITYPLLAPVWLIGLATLLRRRDVRFLGIAYLALIVQMIVLHAKHYYARRRLPDTDCRGCGHNRSMDGARNPLAPRARHLRADCRHCSRSAADAGFAGTHDVRVRPRAANHAQARSESCRHRTHADRQLASRLGRHARLARNWRKPSHASTTRCPRPSALKPQSLQATTARPPRWIFMVRRTAYRRRYRATISIGSGARAATAATCSSTFMETAKIRHTSFERIASSPTFPIRGGDRLKTAFRSRSAAESPCR